MPASYENLPEVPDDMRALVSVRDWIRWGSSEFSRAGLVFGHGTENALDEAFHLVLHSLRLPYDLPTIYLEARLSEPERARVFRLLRQRLETRRPAAYLVQEMEFCGHSFFIDDRVLVPRSPIAELIERGFQPWVDETPRRVLDLCAGSGCIGIACALDLGCDVDLAEIDAGAIEVCGRNIQRHALDSQVRAIQSDLFENLAGQKYDLIVSNPPYVPLEEWEALPAEYHREPRIALEAGEDGMDVVAKILKLAPEHLARDGILFCEVGGSREEFEARWPRLHVTWVEFSRGGDGVFCVSRETLIRAKDL